MNSRHPLPTGLRARYWRRKGRLYPAGAGRYLYRRRRGLRQFAGAVLLLGAIAGLGAFIACGTPGPLPPIPGPIGPDFHAAHDGGGQ